MVNFVFEINNFQGIKHDVIRFSGFTTIQGETSCGKSSIRRALNAILFNVWEASYLSNNAQECSLTLTKLDDDVECYKVNYKRTKSSVTYKLVDSTGEKDFTKPGSSVPSEIQAVLGVSMLDCDKELYNLHLSRQQTIEPLFMIAYSEAQNTRILNRVFNVEKYEIASALCSKDLRASGQKVKQLQDDIQGYECEIATHQEAAIKAQQGVAKLVELADKLQSIDSYLQASSAVQAQQQARADVTSQIAHVEQAEVSMSKIETLNTFAKARKDIKALTEQLISYSNYLYRVGLAADLLSKLESLGEFSSKRNAVKSLQAALSNNNSNLGEVQAQLNSFDVCPYCNSEIRSAL